MRRAGRGLAVAGGVVAVLLLAGCFGPSTESLIAQAEDDFNLLVDAASAVDVAVLHTLEVEKPVAEPCSPDAEDEQTVFVAAGTFAIPARAPDERKLLKELTRSFDEERWMAVDRSQLLDKQSAYLDDDGIVATVTIEGGLLVITVFSPCRAP